MQLKKKRKCRKSKKSKLFLICLIVIYLKAQAQTPDTSFVFEKKKILRTDIDVVYSHYIQDGEHSAITGGTGSEKLSVYAPSIKIVQTIDENIFTLNGGADIISSASKDNIDFIVSSASKLDAHGYGKLSYERILNNQWSVGAGVGVALDSWYFSVPTTLFMNYQSLDKQLTFSATFSAFFDDLRWGRLNAKYKAPTKLIYPAELRIDGVERYSTPLRQSYNAQFGFTHVINKRTLLGFFPQISYQTGLLATPFHRVYFTNGLPDNPTVKVEQLPYERLKILGSLNLNSFIGDKFILKPVVSVYWDTFGILSESIELHTTIKVLHDVTLTPFFRFYNQQASRYFKPYAQHELGQSPFYTSDYDLSEFQTYKFGLEIHCLPTTFLNDVLGLNKIHLRYAFFYRSDHFTAHTFTVAFNIFADFK